MRLLSPDADSANVTLEEPLVRASESLSWELHELNQSWNRMQSDLEAFNDPLCISYR
jgi:hypothetical protein